MTEAISIEQRAQYYNDWARDIRANGGTSVDADFADATAAKLRQMAEALEAAEVLLVNCVPIGDFDNGALHLVRAALSRVSPSETETDGIAKAATGVSGE